MDRRHELARHQTQKDAWAEVVLPQTVAELRVLRERLGEGEGHALERGRVSRGCDGMGVEVEVRARGI